MENLGLEFTVDFPDDHLEAGEGADWEVIRPSGMALTHAVVDLLQANGFVVSELEADIEHESWYFIAEKDGRSHETQVYHLDSTAFLYVWGSSPSFKRLFKRRDHYLEYIEKLRQILSGDQRFGALHWIDISGQPIVSPV